MAFDRSPSMAMTCAPSHWSSAARAEADHAAHRSRLRFIEHIEGWGRGSVPRRV